MNKLTFNITAFIMSFIIYYLFWVFMYFGIVPIAEWSIAARVAWFGLGLFLSIIGVYNSQLSLWDYYYNLKDKS